MKLKYKFAIEKVTDFWAAVPVGRDSRLYNGVMSLNETARDMMLLLAEEITEEDLVKKMMAEYEGVDEEAMRKDVHDFVVKLQDANVLE